MKFHHGNTDPVERFGDMEETTFSIEASQKAFSILIDGLYGDKIRSIVREACANAYDGHIKAGNTDRPFVVHAPTRWEPHFSVRDYGCSMEHSFVMKLYTTLFFSSKDKSDDEAGCFGLGSKAPFAYTQTFTVTTFLGGVKRTYTAFLDDKPRMANNDTVETDEPDGVLVQFPVQEKDFAAFRKAIEVASLGYNVPFECTGVALPKIEYSSRHGDYDIATSGMPENGPLVRIGPVLYRFDKENESAKQVFSELNPDISILLSKADDVILNIPIASGSVLPSREALSYTPKMIQHLAGHLDKICREARVAVDAAFKDCKTPWDYALCYREMMANDTLSRYQKALLAHHQCPFGLTSSTMLVEFVKFREPGAAWVFQDEAGYANTRRRECHNLSREDNVALVIVEAENPVHMLAARVKTLLREKDYERVYLIRTYNPRVQFQHLCRQVEKHDRDTRTKMLKGGFKGFLDGSKRIEQTIKSFGCPTIYKAADLAKPPKQIRPKQPPCVYENKGHLVWSPNALDNYNEDDKTLVLPLDSREFRAWNDVPKAAELCSHLRVLGHRFKHVLGVSRSKIAALRTLCPKWVVWDDLIRDKDKLELDRLVMAAESYAFVRWYSVLAQPVARAKRLSNALAYCDAKTKRKFDEFMTAVEGVSAKASSARKRIDAMVNSGCAPALVEYKHPIIDKMLELLALPATGTPEDGDAVKAAEKYLYVDYPELAGLLDPDYDIQNAVLASYLMGRHLTSAPIPTTIMLPLDEAEAA